MFHTYIYVSIRSITCKGYIEKRLGQRGPMSSYCFDCRIERKKMADRIRKKVFNPRGKIRNKTQKSAKQLKRKVSRLRNKVS